MVELLVRLCVCLVFLLAGLLGYAPFDASWKAAAALAGLSFFGWRLEAKGLKRAGIGGFFAIVEAFILALLLAAAGSLNHLGFLVLVPCIYAGARFGSPMISMAPLAASCLVAAGTIYSKQGIPSLSVLAHAAGVLSVSLLLGQRRQAVTPPQLLPEAPELPEQQPQLIEDGLLQLRENYRKLRDAYNDLERRSRRDKIAARIAKAQTADGDRFYPAMCAALREIGQAEELAIYTLAQFDKVMVVRSVSEDFPGDLKDQSVEVDLGKAPALVREQAEQALAAVNTGGSVANVLLIDKGRVIGMVCAIDSKPEKLDEIRKRLTEAAPIAAKAIEQEAEREANARRVKELELLYEISSITSGATTTTALAGRVVRELHQSLRLRSVSVVFVDKGKELTVAKEGVKAKLLDCMSFANGPGLKGWIDTGHPELILFDARQDQRCDPEETLKRRIGSFVLIPLWTGTEVAGYLSASSQVAGGIDADQIGTLRLVGAELSRAIERLGGAHNGGLMTPKEFAEATAGRQGCLVYIEPLRREQIASAYGQASLDEAVRKLAHQVRAKLPAGGSLCRRDQGDFLVFLDTEEEFARTWANEVAASASFIAIPTSDPAKRIPLALRAKVAKMTSQYNQLSAEIAA